MEDLGTIPTLEQWLTELPIEPWMMGKHKPKETTHIPFPQSPGITIQELDGSLVKRGGDDSLDNIFIDGNQGWRDRIVKTPEQPLHINNWPEIIVKD